MGKGFNNYMCKKFFHPASRDNLKRVWMAEQKAESYKKKQEELRVQYEKEQDMYTKKAILSKESKDKLSVNFMYEPPPGTKKEREREDDEPEYKFEWQRKFNAPREDYCKGDSEIRDQPFGIQVRNVRCIKCHKWGHINTDKECPMYNLASSSDQTGASVDPLILLQQIREDGLAMKRTALNTQQHIKFPLTQDLMLRDDEDEKMKLSEVEFLKSLSVKQKQRLLRKLEKLERKDKSSKSNKRRKNKKKSKRKLKDSDNDESSSDSEESERGRKWHKKKKRSKKDKDKKRDKHCKNVSIKEEPSSSSEPESLNKTLVKVMTRRIDFVGPSSRSEKCQPHVSSDGSSDRGHKKTNRMKVERDKSHKEEVRNRDEKSVNGVRHSRGNGKLSDEGYHRKRLMEGNGNSSRKKQRQ